MAEKPGTASPSFRIASRGSMRVQAAGGLVSGAVSEESQNRSQSPRPQPERIGSRAVQIPRPPAAGDAGVVKHLRSVLFSEPILRAARVRPKGYAIARLAHPP